MDVTRDSGLVNVGEIPWGTHFCQFYRTKSDLLELLVPYFKAGLENRESCLWVIYDLLTVQDAQQALREALSDIDKYLARSQMEIVSYRDWYFKQGRLDPDAVLSDLLARLLQAQSQGYVGLRLGAEAFWLETEGWSRFVRYEEDLNRSLAGRQLLAFCSYSQEKCGMSEIIDVVAGHQLTLEKRNGQWQLIESWGHKCARLTEREKV